MPRPSRSLYDTPTWPRPPNAPDSGLPPTFPRSVLEGRVGSGQSMFSLTTDLAWSVFLQADRPLTRPLRDP